MRRTADTHQEGRSGERTQTRRRSLRIRREDQVVRQREVFHGREEGWLPQRSRNGFTRWRTRTARRSRRRPAAGEEGAEAGPMEEQEGVAEEVGRRRGPSGRPRGGRAGAAPVIAGWQSSRRSPAGEPARPAGLAPCRAPVVERAPDAAAADRAPPGRAPDHGLVPPPRRHAGGSSARSSRTRTATTSAGTTGPSPPPPRSRSCATGWASRSGGRPSTCPPGSGRRSASAS